jgi:hypothetical protein
MKKKLNTFLLVMLLIMIMLRISSTFAQESNPWEITVDPDMPNITTIEVDKMTIPFLSKVERIWDESKSGLPYNAFTDLILFRGNWYCAFREAEIHNNHDTGRARVLRSADGKTWKPVALFEWAGGDVRDPKLSITPEGQLMLNTSIFFISKTPYQRRSVTWLSSDGETWSDVFACTSGINTWRWSVTWHNGVGYSFGITGKGLTPGNEAFGTLFTTGDGKIWTPLAKNVFPGDQGNETSIVFGENDIAYCLLRNGGAYPGPGGYRTGHLGIAKSPYTEWTWSDLDKVIGGPEMIRLKDGRLLAGVRMHGKTILAWIDPERGIMKKFLVLPSGGQGGSSYPGIVEYEGMIWISYYSGHESERIDPVILQGRDRTYDYSPVSIYLAKVKLAPKTNSQ